MATQPKRLWLHKGPSACHVYLSIYFSLFLCTFYIFLFCVFLSFFRFFFDLSVYVYIDIQYLQYLSFSLYVYLSMSISLCLSTYITHICRLPWWESPWWSCDSMMVAGVALWLRKAPNLRAWDCGQLFGDFRSMADTFAMLEDALKRLSDANYRHWDILGLQFGNPTEWKSLHKSALLVGNSSINGWFAIAASYLCIDSNESLKSNDRWIPVLLGGSQDKGAPAPHFE